MLSKEAWLWVKVNLSKNNPATLIRCQGKYGNQGSSRPKARCFASAPGVLLVLRPREPAMLRLNTIALPPRACGIYALVPMRHQRVAQCL